jgi:glycosyltransferase involved in cell wall biosynthesis
MRTEISVSSLKTNLRKLLLLTADSVFVSSKSAEKYVRSLNSEVPVVVCAQTGATQVVETKVSKVIGNGHASKPLKLIFVGSGAPRKNLEKSILWLSAWAEQTNTTVKLMAVGDFESVRTKESSRLSVEYASYLEGLELTQCYDKADALFFPTLEDEWGIVVNESLGRGLAVIGSLHSEAVVDLVQDQPFGFSFCPDDYLSFCAAMDKYKVAAQSQESFLGSSSLAIQCALNSSPKKFAAALASCVK